MADVNTTDAMERPREHRENRKKNMGRKVEANQARAVARDIRVPPRKARLVIDAVRGRYVEEALAFLRFIPNRAAGYISKVLMSAAANAANNHGLNAENLKLVEARVDEGPRWKRVQPRAQGRAYHILKRTSHITVIVQEVAPKPRKPRKQAGRRADAARAARRQPEAASPATAPTTATPVVAEQPTPATVVEETPVVAEPTPTAAVEETPTVAEATTPTETASETVPEGPQTANTEDTTDEIGAPTDVEAEQE